MVVFNRYFKLLFCIIVFSFCRFSYSANILFDLYGILVTDSGAFRKIGISKFFGNFNPIRTFKIKDFIFDMLDSIEPRTLDTPLAYDEDRLLPKIMCDFLCGIKNADEVKSLIMKRLEVMARGIDSQRKVKLIEAIVDFMFTPELFAQAIVPIKKGVQLLKKCYQEKDAQGNRAHKIFIITNWGKESFIYLYNNRKIARMLDMADGIVVSGKVGYMKPCKEIYEYAFDYFKINPEDELTYYIDDQLCNIQAARMLGYRSLKCFHVQHYDFAALDKNLRRFGIY